MAHETKEIKAVDAFGNEFEAIVTFNWNGIKLISVIHPHSQLGITEYFINIELDSEYEMVSESCDIIWLNTNLDFIREED